MTGPFVPDCRIQSLFIDLCEGQDSKFVLPSELGELERLHRRRTRRGRGFERPNFTWTVVIFDRAPGHDGPESFDPATLKWLFENASRIGIDTAEPHRGLYQMIGEEGVAQRLRQLIIRTVEGRRLVWCEFTRANSDLYGGTEVVPGADRQIEPFVTWFEGRTPNGVRSRREPSPAAN